MDTVFPCPRRFLVDTGILQGDRVLYQLSGFMGDLSTFGGAQVLGRYVLSDARRLPASLGEPCEHSRRFL